LLLRSSVCQIGERAEEADIGNLIVVEIQFCQIGERAEEAEVGNLIAA
jgi:hypothetical protein